MVVVRAVLRFVANHTYRVFAWDRIDPASALLAEHLPADLAGRAAALGAGYGYLSRELLERCPKITALDLYEAEQRALALALHGHGLVGDLDTGGRSLGQRTAELVATEQLRACRAPARPGSRRPGRPGPPPAGGRGRPAAGGGRCAAR
ncbi:hypothetical protein G6F32_015094 [Rhizopus arrhizus]|nr:hypothetical protein G6F32_015094 [Rhizopus arrhizus]